jgi:hypothetical protein
MVASMFVLMGASRVIAAPSPIYRGSDVKFTLGGSVAESTVVAEGLGVRVTKRIGPEFVKISIEVANDVVDVDANATGRVRLSRRGRSVTLNMRARDAQLIAEARRMTEGSQALRSFGALMTAIEGDSRPVAQSMWPTWGLVNALRGNDAAVISVAARFKAAADKGPFTPVSFTREREDGPTACWAEYSVLVNRYYGEFSSCLVDYAWIPMGAQSCMFEWMVKSELAWFWLIECDGGIPK